MSTTRFCLIRHGETTWNTERRLQGHTDTPLNSRGEIQARQMAQALKNANLSFDILYSSDLQRAVNTANAIEQLFGVQATIESALRERHFGVLQGLSIEQAPIAHPAIWQAHIARELDHDLAGGESILQFAARVEGVIEKLRMLHSGKTILLVSHGGTLDMMYRIASKQSLGSERIVSVPNASLNWIVHNDQGWSVERWADTRHLEDGALENVDL
ncbi:MAG: histidine phosphatase family protein [Polynucleobacter sp. 17-46-58]|nr:MAG: histidine phosphatase family protein [Polynucleobacter sp. 16-46-70]OZA40819.1 MAG: histidine phosphatase family protein [Polynucleobacter sp. 17-46-58]HQR84235.1 histidine phosphatase family protein [Polynucleobacter sp.]HQS60416.1 histidine phosphatase family protein [Polynucleobacter sp.]HQT19872.1 histidine phosphatase family protein [Polynucleobacter sp.]